MLNKCSFAQWGIFSLFLFNSFKFSGLPSYLLIMKESKMIRYIHVYLFFSLSPRNNGILKDHCREKTVLITNRRNSNNGDFRHYSRHWGRSFWTVGGRDRKRISTVTSIYIQRSSPPTDFDTVTRTEIMERKGFFPL